MYQIAHLGDEDDEPEFSSAMPLEEGDTFFFAPRPLRNLVLVDELDSLSPILGNFEHNYYSNSRVSNRMYALTVFVLDHPGKPKANIFLLQKNIIF